jgi:hypothetical protein
MLAKTPHTFLSLLIISILLISFTTPAYKVNFLGTWVLNVEKSELGPFGIRGSASKIVVDQKTDAITITKTAANSDGSPAIATETLGNDEKEVETQVSATAKKKSILKWSADGNAFTITFTVSTESTSIKGTETWGLGADGKTLILQRLLNLDQGDVSTKVVYDKQ